MERQETLAREHSEEYMGALQRVVTLLVPHAYSSSKYGTFNEVEDSHRWSGESSFGSSKTRENWNELIEHLFDKDESGHMLSRNHKGMTDHCFQLEKTNEKREGICLRKMTLIHYSKDYR